jgi:long-chain acyl-CoA synthetase
MSKLYSILINNANRFPDKEAVIEGERRWTYREFLKQVDQAAAGFKEIAVNPGDRVGLMLFNQKEFLVSFFALRKIGAVVVPINIQMLPQDICFVIQNSGIKHMVIADSLFENIKDLPLRFVIVGDAGKHVQSYESFMAEGAAQGEVPNANTPETDLSFLLYTSGTTGHPKGVMLTERNLLANIEGFGRIVDFGEQDRMILALPLFHAYGLIIALTGLNCGATMTLIPKFSPRGIVDAVVKEQATILPLVPTLFVVILEVIAKRGGIDTSHLRFCVSGGASLPAQLLQRIESVLNVPVIEGYGLTETSPVLTINDPKVGSIPSCVGKPLHNVQVRIVHEDNTECSTGEVGEILVKGENVMSGYFNLPEETRAVLTEDGWFRTGDLGHLDEAGHLFISGGRKKDLIIKAGENISPLSIEEVLYRHEAVREAAVIGIPDERVGEEILACVSLNEGQSVTAQELIRFCREHLSAAYVPSAVEFFDELPKNPTGKIVKKLLRESLAKRTTASSP